MATYLSVDVELLMRRCTVADPHWSRASIAFQMIKLDLWQVRLAMNGEHDGQRACGCLVVLNSIHDE
jgi:hypothetical protein